MIYLNIKSKYFIDINVKHKRIKPMCLFECNYVLSFDQTLYTWRVGQWGFISSFT